jgi:hypothetical protein
MQRSPVAVYGNCHTVEGKSFFCKNRIFFFGPSVARVSGDHVIRSELDEEERKGEL